MMLSRRTTCLWVAVVALTIGLGAGVALGLTLNHSPGLRSGKDLMNLSGLGRYQYTNELLACGDIDNLSVGSMEGLKTRVEKDLVARMSSGAISYAAVYVRDLDNGPWLGINEKDYFYPASLLKVPLIFAAYKKEEVESGFLDAETPYEHAFLNTEYEFPPKERIELGKRYTNRELLRRAIVYSDNEAAALLGSALGFDAIKQVFYDFGIQMPRAGEDYKMRVRTYSSFFRVLYNASYISRDHSEEGLALLTQSDFKDGIAKPLPKTSQVAHKFGEREGALENGDLQLHDCGIVYGVSRPYLLCVMAQAKTTDAILDFMHFVSREAYETMLRE